MEPFITKDEREVPLRAVGRRWVQQVLSRHELPEVPYYEATTIAGVVEKHLHRVTDKGTTLTTPEEHQAWAEYQAETTRVEVLRTKEITDFLIFECVALDPPVPGEWHVNLELHGFQLPDPEDELNYKRFWVENELLPDTDDMAGLLARLYTLGGLIEEDKIEEFEGFFRLTVARLSARGADGSAVGKAEAED